MTGRKTPMPQPFLLNQQDKDFCLSLGMTEDEIKYATDDFTDWALSEGDLRGLEGWMEKVSAKIQDAVRCPTSQGVRAKKTGA